jgi:ABC-type transport system substrate-binding protein
VKKFLVIPLVILMIAGLCVTGACGQKGVVAGTTITNAVPDFGYESTDPIYMESLWGWMMYDSLLRWDKDGNFIGGVADSWDVSPDGCTWTFHIHKGITFHNGDPLTAYDVKFSVDRFGDMSISSNPWSKYISSGYNKKDSYVVDDYTYVFVSDHAEPAQAIAFAWTRILPKNYFESVGQDGFRAHPIGSGPWKWVELVSKTSMKLEANADYWRKDEIPHFQYYVELMVPELATRVAMLKTGECDMAAIDYDRINDLVADGFKTETFMPPATCSLFFQGTWLAGAGPTSDIRVRQAMSYALNRQEISDTYFSGFAKPGGQFYMYPGCYGWSDALAADPYDPQKAEELLAEANYPAAFSDPTIHIYTTTAYGLYGGQDLVLLLMNYWKAVGLDVKMEVVDSTIAAGYTFQGFFGAPIKVGDPNVGWCGIWNYQAFFNSTYHAANMYTPGGAHCTSNDAHAKELYDKATTELDPKKAAQYFNDFEVYAKSLYINIGIVQLDTIYVYNPKTIGGWDSNARTWVSFWDAANGIKQP